MNKALGLALFAVGVLLLFMGYQAAHSVGSSVSKFFNGTPSDKAIWLFVSGALTSAAGAVLFFKK